MGTMKAKKVYLIQIYNGISYVMQFSFKYGYLHAHLAVVKTVFFQAEAIQNELYAKQGSSAKIA